MRITLLLLLPLTFLSSTDLAQCQDTIRPDVFTFGATIVEIREGIKSYCISMDEKDISPMQLPTAKRSQKQIDCSGFLFAGKERLVELVFADDTLDLVWVLTEPSEELEFIDTFTKQYGEPTHRLEDVTFFLDHGAGVRNQPHEILFISDRLKPMYQQWLDSRQ